MYYNIHVALPLYMSTPIAKVSQLSTLPETGTLQYMHNHVYTPQSMYSGIYTAGKMSHADFTEEEHRKFEKQLREGYDLKIDHRYNMWKKWKESCSGIQHAHTTTTTNITTTNIIGYSEKKHTQ